MYTIEKRREKLWERGWGMLCRHCGVCSVSRPRGLCWSCYYAPGIRERYPAKYVLSATPDGHGRSALPETPTRAVPGSEEKIEVLGQRARRRLELWHPGDARVEEGAK
jgi:hypothetical protein